MIAAMSSGGAIAAFSCTGILFGVFALEARYQKRLARERLVAQMQKAVERFAVSIGTALIPAFRALSEATVAAAESMRLFLSAAAAALSEDERTGR